MVNFENVSDDLSSFNSLLPLETISFRVSFVSCRNKINFIVFTHRKKERKKKMLKPVLIEVISLCGHFLPLPLHKFSFHIYVYKCVTG